MIDKNEYCASSNTHNIESNCKAFYDGEQGACVQVDFKPFTVDGKEYWISNARISWWDTDAACKALGMELVDVDDLVEKWKGGTGSYTRTTLSEVSFNKFGHHLFWTQNPVDNDCYMFSVLNLGEVHSHASRAWNNYLLGLCKPRS